MDKDEIKELIKQGNYDAVLENDQLRVRTLFLSQTLCFNLWQILIEATAGGQRVQELHRRKNHVSAHLQV